jgi:hypothetical protein
VAITIRNKVTEQLIRKIGRRTGEGPSAVIRRLAEREAANDAGMVSEEEVERRIAEFEKLTGVPIIINTSFNVRGEPIVCTPEDAFRCFMGTEIEVLVAGNCVLHKERQDERVEHGNGRGLGGGEEAAARQEQALLGLVELETDPHALAAAHRRLGAHELHVDLEAPIADLGIHGCDEELDLAAPDGRRAALAGSHPGDVVLVDRHAEAPAGKVVERHDSDQSLLLIQHRKAAHLMLGHEPSDLVDRLVVEADQKLGRHQIANRPAMAVVSVNAAHR